MTIILLVYQAYKQKHLHHWHMINASGEFRITSLLVPTFAGNTMFLLTEDIAIFGHAFT